MIYQYFLGIDTSKATLDYWLYHKGEKLSQRYEIHKLIHDEYR